LEPLLRRLITEDIDFHIMYDSTDPTIFADSVQIDQVVINLVTNARDAMPGGGTLTVKTTRSEVSRERARELGLKEPGDYTVLTIADSGAGMSDEVKARLFDPFFTTKEVGHGTGLGLSIVYGIVGQHGGAITVQSKLGEGSRFDVYLPVHQGPVTRMNQPVLQPPGGSETVLLAEDDTSVRNMVTTILTVSGYTVVEAEDGEDALTKFRQHADAIDLVILDVVMPRKNGREVCEWIRERKPTVKFLFTSGYTKNIIDEKGFSEEGVDFIAKPSHPHELLQKIRHVLGSTT
jgi:CheY-like chemotaxis protein